MLNKELYLGANTHGLGYALSMYQSVHHQATTTLHHLKTREWKQWHANRHVVMVLVRMGTLLRVKEKHI
jgi:hypothetical protein